MTSIKTSTRYSSFDSRSSTHSHNSDPSSSADLKSNASSFNRIIAGANSCGNQSPALQRSNSSRAIVRTNTAQLATKGKNEPKFTAMVKNFMEKRSKPKAAAAADRLLIPVDFIAEDLKKTARKGSNLSAIHRKIFSKGSSGSGSKTETKALTEVKANTRTLAMVLRSERELLSQNKDLEAEATELKLTIEERNREVEKLKDLCIKQREEIKALKSSILFPDLMNSQLQDLLEKQDLELTHAKQLIPSLQRQVTDLTGQINSLAEDLQEVKADQYSSSRGGGYYGGAYCGSPKTPQNGREALYSLEFSPEDRSAPGTPDDMLLLTDLNPCLTPYSIKKMSKEFQGIGLDYSPDDHLHIKTSRVSDSCVCSGKAHRSEGRKESSTRWNTHN